METDFETYEEIVTHLLPPTFLSVSPYIFHIVSLLPPHFFLLSPVCRSCIQAKATTWTFLSYPIKQPSELHAFLLVLFPMSVFPIYSRYTELVNSTTRRQCLPPKWDTSRSRTSLSVRKLCLPPNRPIDEGRWNCYCGQSGCKASRSTCPGSEAPGGNCHRVEVGWQTNKDPGGLSLTLPTPDQVGPYRLLERRAPCPYGGWP
jgi:hypothetical protein